MISRKCKSKAADAMINGKVDVVEKVTRCPKLLVFAPRLRHSLCPRFSHAPLHGALHVASNNLAERLQPAALMLYQRGHSP